MIDVKGSKKHDRDYDFEFGTGLPGNERVKSRRIHLTSDRWPDIEREVTSHVSAFKSCGLDSDFSSEASYTLTKDENMLDAPGYVVTDLPAFHERSYVGEVISLPSENVIFGDLRYPLKAHITLFCTVRDAFLSELEKIKSSDPILYEEEKNRATYIGLAAHGLKTISDAGQRRILAARVDDFKCDPKIQKLHDTYFKSKFQSIKDESNLKISLPLFKSSGYPFYSTGIDIRRNVLCMIASAKYGSDLALGKCSLMDVERMWPYELPWNTQLYAHRATASGKKRLPVAVYQNDMLRFMGSGFLLFFRERTISISSKVLVVANRIAAKRALAALQLMPPHSTNPTKMNTDIQQWFKAGMSAFASDYTNYDKTIPQNIAHTALKLLAKSSVEEQTLLCEYDAPWLLKNRTEHSLGFLYETKGSILGSGVSTTSYIGNYVNALVHRIIATEVFGDPSLSRFGIDYAYKLWGDDGLFFCKDLSVMSKVEEIKEKLGFKPDTTDRPIFLMRYYDKRRGCNFNLMSRSIQQFFEPERPKLDKLVCTLALGAHYLMLKDHPLVDWWCTTMKKVFDINKEIVMIEDPKKAADWMLTEEAKTLILEYSVKNSITANNIQRILYTVTSGLDSDWDDEDDGNILSRLFGVLNFKSEASIDVSTIEDFNIRKLSEQLILDINKEGPEERNQLYKSFYGPLVKALDLDASVKERLVRLS